jgi:lipopolysaccharide export system protein LptA
MTAPSPRHFPRAAELLLAASLAVLAGGAAAEKADRQKPLNIEADRMLVDDTKKESMFEGNVVVTQGTLQLRGDRILVRQDAEGFSYGIAWGRPATFRQKRDGVDEYIDGFAERLEFDGRKDLLQMFNAARLTKGGDEVRGDYISYNATTEFFQVNGSAGNAQAQGGAGGGRVRAVIQPKPRPGEAAPGETVPGTAAPAAAPGSPLKPSTDLSRGKP